MTYRGLITFAFSASCAAALAQEPPVEDGQGESSEDDLTEELEIIDQIDVNDMIPATEETCFQSMQIRGFQALTDEFVLLENIRDEFFLLSMFPGCPGLQGDLGIALVSDLNRVCSNSNAQVRYRGSDGGLTTCPIMKIESVESRQAGRRVAELRSLDR